MAPIAFYTTPQDTSGPPHLPSSFVIMKIHGGPCVLPRLQRVHELLGDGLAEAQVVAAASPQPAMTAWQ